MIGSHWRGVLFFASLIGGIACGPAWRRIEPTGAGFTVQMPANTECDAREWKKNTATASWVGRTCDAEAEPLIRWLPFSTSTYIQYSISWTEIPAGLEQASLEAVLSEFEAPELESRSQLIAEGQRFWETEGKEKYGVEYRTSAAPLGGVRGLHREGVPSGTVKVPGFAGRMRVAVHRGRLYLVTIGGLGGARLDEIWNRMLGSFQFEEVPES